MTIEQRKIALINWITNLDDETVIGQIENVQRKTLDELPSQIVSLLEISDTAVESDCIEHTSARDLLRR